MRRLLFLLPVALLLPHKAHAAGLADVIATTIAYSKWIVMLVAMALIFRAVVNATSNKPIGPTLTLTLLATIIFSIILSVVSALGISFVQGGDIAAAGRSYTEYMDAQSGLLTAAVITNLGWYSLISIAVVFASVAVVFLKGFESGDDKKMASTLRAYFIPLGILLAIFNPWWQTASTNNAQQLISNIKAHQVASTGPDNLRLPGPMPSTSTVLPQVANSTTQMLPIPQGEATKSPFMLSTINTAMDEFIASIVKAVAAKGFSEFGMAGVEGMMSSLSGSLPSWIVPNLRQRLLLFTDTCTEPELQNRLNNDPAVAQAWATDPQKMVSSFDPFSFDNLQWFNHQPGFQSCSRMIVGGYNWAPSNPREVTPGNQYPLGIREEILANAALADPRIRADYPQMKTVQDAATLMPQIKQKYSDWENMVLEIFDKAILASYQRQSQSAAVDPASGTALGNFAKNIETRIFQVVSTAKQAGATAQIDLEMPIWMGLFQFIWLAMFPVVFLFSLMPGLAGTMSNYFLTLLWSKSYIIAWALISNFDHWQATALSYMGSPISDADKLATIHAIQFAQMLSPGVMLLVFFGPKVGAMIVSKVGGA